MTTSGITNINAKLIHQHPDNPRKDLGDLTELSESIKKKGIMQNLTVIPGYWDEKRTHHEEGYTLIIGHRRFAAGKMAGVTMYPCRIVEDMSYKDQVGTMLEENMQRIDLTVLEQAEGFQMMLDLGDTEEQIAEKTGFSRTTVHRRLEIAKLDRDLVKEKTDENGGYQLNLKDLAELSRIEDVETRNRILKDAADSRQIQWKVEEEIKNRRLFLLGRRCDVNNILRDSDIFLFATYNENHSIALMEAVNMHCAVLCTNVGGNAEIIQDKVSGLLIPSKDSNSIIDGLKELKDKEIRDKYVYKAFKECCTKFSSENTYGKLEKIFKD